jgi:hypothetical protein
VQAWNGVAPPASAPPAPTNWIFIDRSLSDPEVWLAPLQGEVVYLDPLREGPRQIAEWLQGTPGVQSVHILSHGVGGRLPLGASVLDSLSICDEHDEAMAVIAGLLAADALLHLHGYVPDESASGERLVEVLAAVTGANVRVQTAATMRGAPQRAPGAQNPETRRAFAGQTDPREEDRTTDAPVRTALLSAFEHVAIETVNLFNPTVLPAPTHKEMQDPRVSACTSLVIQS